MAENRNTTRVKDCEGSGEGSGAPPGLSHIKDSEEWGSIADLLKSIENTNKSRCAKGKSPPPPQPRMPPLTENIQSAELEGMPSLQELQRGQGMQQLNHLLRLMDQMCALKMQNSKLREQAEYLAAIKNLHELRNETMRQNCHCEAQRRASDLSSSSGSRFEHTHATGESLSEPESQVGEDMDGDIAVRGGKRGRSSKRDGWEKVKHAMSKRHLAEVNRQRLMTSSTEESPPVAKRQEMAEDGYLTPGDSTDDGIRNVPSRRGDGSKKSHSSNRDCSFNEHDPLARSSSSKSDHSTSSFSEEFARKLQEWEKMRLRPTGDDA